MGAGAVGGYFGARLAAAGHDVSFIARGEHLRAMQKSGLRIKSILGDLEIHSTFVSSSDQIAPVDLILLAVKSQDTEVAAKSLTSFMGPRTTVLSLQNGVDNAEKIARLWGSGRTLAAVAYIVARVSAPGTIEHSAGGRLVLGSVDEGGQEYARAAHSTFAAAHIFCDISSDIRTVLWKKLAWNSPFCALSCLLRMKVGELLGLASLEAIVRSCIEEVRDAARCRGVDLPASLAQEALSFSTTLRDAKPSMLQDLEAGKPLEYEALNGIVVKILQQAGKRAPLNEIFYTALKQIDRELRAKQNDLEGLASMNQKWI
jgi:2-dehydropantoate 2-reductase